MKRSLLVAMTSLAALALDATPAFAGMYVTGSVASSQSHMGFTDYESNYGSASFGFDLWRYVRLSFTHSQELSVSQGYKDPNAKSSDATNAANDDDPTTDDQLVEYYTRTHVTGNSADLQLILYEGQVFVPYIMGGLIIKRYVTESREGETDYKNDSGPVPGPNVGAGLGIRLNKEFTLKLSYIASLGATREPFAEKSKTVWDRKVTVGLTYQL